MPLLDLVLKMACVQGTSLPAAEQRLCALVDFDVPQDQREIANAWLAKNQMYCDVDLAYEVLDELDVPDGISDVLRNLQSLACRRALDRAARGIPSLSGVPCQVIVSTPQPVQHREPLPASQAAKASSRSSKGALSSWAERFRSHERQSAVATVKELANIFSEAGERGSWWNSFQSMPSDVAFGYR